VKLEMMEGVIGECECWLFWCSAVPWTCERTPVNHVLLLLFLFLLLLFLLLLFLFLLLLLLGVMHCKYPPPGQSVGAQEVSKGLAIQLLF
jgi:hypothetical protein